MEKVVLSGHIIVPLADRDAFKEALAEHIELTRNEPGCLTFEGDEDGEQLKKGLRYRRGRKQVNLQKDIITYKKSNYALTPIFMARWIWILASKATIRPDT